MTARDTLFATGGCAFGLMVGGIIYELTIPWLGVGVSAALIPVLVIASREHWRRS